MRRLTRLCSSSVGKKVVMAVTGIVLILFVLAHMAGNLKAFQGPEAFNGYAEALREIGYPLLPRRAALWILRAGLLAAAGLHVWAAYRLYRTSRAARNVGYRKRASLSFSYASRTMRWGGVILLAFVVYHVLHFTTGTAHLDFVRGDPYGNLVSAFRRPLVSLAYVTAMAALALHLYHGVWSTFQTLGLSHPKYDRLRRPLAGAMAVLLFVGFAAVPLAVMAGWIS